MRNVIALAAVMSALPFAAGSAQSRFTQAPAEEQQGRQEIRFAEMDLNGDGVITRAEWRGTRQAFENEDLNGDGILSGNEVRTSAVRNPRSATVNNRQRQQQLTRFRNLDTDRDGIVSRWEWPDTWQAFNALDRNGDDVLTQAEVIAETDTQDTTIADDAAVSNRGRAIRRGVATSGEIVRVDGRTRWTDSGLDVVAGDRIYFDAEGNMQLSEGGPDASTPAGAASGRRAANAPLPRAVAGALLARIGGSAPLLIGAQRTIARAPVSGRLYLGVNDDHLPDNSGEYRVSVTIEGR